MTTYYTYKSQVPLLPGQTLAFETGKGYYAAGTPTPNQATRNTTAAPPSTSQPVGSSRPASSAPANAGQVARNTTGLPPSIAQPVGSPAPARPAAAISGQVARNTTGLPASIDDPVGLSRAPGSHAGGVTVVRGSARPVVTTGKLNPTQPMSSGSIPLGSRGGGFVSTMVASSRIVASTAERAGLPARVADERPPYPWISPSHPEGPHYSDAQLRAFGATPDEIWIINHESGGYTHAWNYAPTPSGYAYGLGQVTGSFRLEHFGNQWQSADPRVQIKMMQLYIRIGSPHFHTDAGALAFWQANGWY